jgi:hypothetical protein
MRVGLSSYADGLRLMSANGCVGGVFAPAASSCGGGGEVCILGKAVFGHDPSVSQTYARGWSGDD